MGVSLYDSRISAHNIASAATCTQTNKLGVRHGFNVCLANSISRSDTPFWASASVSTWLDKGEYELLVSRRCYCLDALPLLQP